VRAEAVVPIMLVGRPRGLSIPRSAQHPKTQLHLEAFQKS
jgi:hypothetical protein